MGGWESHYNKHFLSFFQPCLENLLPHKTIESVVYLRFSPPHPELGRGGLSVSSCSTKNDPLNTIHLKKKVSGWFYHFVTGYYTSLLNFQTANFVGGMIPLKPHCTDVPECLHRCRCAIFIPPVLRVIRYKKPGRDLMNTEASH